MRADRAELRRRPVTTAFATQLDSPKLTLAALQSKLDAVVAAAAAGLQRGAAPGPPASLQSAHQEVLATLQLRAIGLAGLANTLARRDRRTPRRSAAHLAKQAQVLSASDLVWTELFQVPATETLEEAGRDRRDRSAVADHRQSRGDQPHLVRGGLRRPSSPRRTNGKVTGPARQRAREHRGGLGRPVEDARRSPARRRWTSSANLAFKVTFTNVGQLPGGEDPRHARR